MFPKRTLVLAIIFFIGVASAGAVSAAWVDAPALPPGYGTLDQNTFKPLNLSDAPQAKQGRLGIGMTTAPRENLEVAGNILMSGALYDIDQTGNTTTYYIDPAGAFSGKLRGTLDVGGTLTAQGQSVCLGNNIGCPTAANYWTLSGTNLYASSTTYNVGIGTTSPAAKLDVRDSSDRPLLLTNSTNSNHSFLNAISNAHLSGNAYWNPADSSWNHFDTTRGASLVDAVGDGTIHFYTIGPGANPITSWGTPKMYINPTGNVGIGTTSPDGTLDVMKTISGLTTGLRFSSWHFPGITAGGIIDSYDDGGTVRSLVLQNNGGNVGIGTTSPVAKLDVQGSIVTRGDAIEIGGSKPVGSPANQYAYLDLRGDDTYWDYGLRLLRGDTGPNTWSEISHRGTGDFIINANDPASLKFRTQNVDRMTIDSAGKVGIGTTNPISRLSVSWDANNLGSSAIFGVSTGNAYAGIWGEAQGTTYIGIYGRGNDNLASSGVYGYGGIFSGSIGVNGGAGSGADSIGVNGVGGFGTNSVGGRFAAQSGGYNLKLPARNDSARGIYLYVQYGSACASGETMLMQGEGPSPNLAFPDTDDRILCGKFY